MLGLTLYTTLLLGAPEQAFAQSNEAIAESLFIEGKQLYTEQKYAEACNKLAQSHKADPAGGTVLLLAMCYEKLGRTASAWAKYGEAVAMARRDGRADRAQKAQESMEALRTKLSYATVTLAAEAKQHTNMEFVLDDVAIPVLIDAKVPVDPGAHRLVVRAKGFQSWSHEFEVTDPGAVVTITVPALEPTPQEAPASPTPTQPSLIAKSTVGFDAPPAPDARSSSTTRSVGWVLGGLGLVSAGVGGYFAYRANSLDKKSNDRCPSLECSDNEAIGWNKDALRDARVSTWLVGVGAAAAVAGGALVLFGGSEGRAVTATAWATPSGGALSVAASY